MSNKLNMLYDNDYMIINTLDNSPPILDQSVYEKYGPNLQKVATEMKPFDLTSYIYCL